MVHVHSGLCYMKWSDLGSTLIISSLKRTSLFLSNFRNHVPNIYSIHDLLQTTLSTNSPVFCINRSLMCYNIDLVWQARRLEKEGRLTELVDETISSFPRDVALKCIRIGLLCCQESTQDRPTMSYVVEVLSDDSVTIPIPVWHGYQEALEPNNSIYYSACSMSESFSMNSKIISNLADYKLH